VPKFSDWNYAAECVEKAFDPMEQILALSDKFFDGALSIRRRKGLWFVSLGDLPLTEAAHWEMLTGPQGLSFMEAVEETLKKAAPLSEEG